MATDSDEIQTISVSDFKARCTEQLRAVEEQGITLRVTRHGKVVALVQPPKPDGPTVGEWIGSGSGMMAESAADLFDEPTWKPGEWEMEREEDNL